MKKLLTLIIPIMTLIACDSACDIETDLEKPSGTYYYGVKGSEISAKIALEIIPDKAYIAFYPENEEKLKSELSNFGLTLTDITEGRTFGVSNPTEEACGIINNYLTAIVTGDYGKASSSVRPLTIGWSPYYKVIDEEDFMPGREIASTIAVEAKLKDGVDKARLLEFAKKNDIIYAGHFLNYEEWHILIVTNDSRGNTLEMANRLMESGLCECSLPDFLGIFTILSSPKAR